MIDLPVIRKIEDMIAMVEHYGMMPFAGSGIPGFSIWGCATEIDGDEGPWEWKGPVIERTGCAYGKLLGGKTAFVTKEWYADLAAYRRDGDDFDILWDEGRVSQAEKRIVDVLASCPSMNARQLKREAGFVKSSAFDAAIAKLQEKCYVTIVDFDYDYDKFGQKRGWAVTRYALPEKRFGQDYIDAIYDKTPEEAYERLLSHMVSILGEEHISGIKRMLG